MNWITFCNLRPNCENSWCSLDSCLSSENKTKGSRIGQETFGLRQWASPLPSLLLDVPWLYHSQRTFILDKQSRGKTNKHKEVGIFLWLKLNVFFSVQSQRALHRVDQRAFPAVKIILVRSACCPSVISWWGKNKQWDWTHLSQRGV